MVGKKHDVSARARLHTVWPSFRSAQLAHQALAFSLSFLLVFQPLLAQAQDLQADANAAAANQPQIGAAGNGVPLVNIVTPNSAGLSHNKYSDFNVGTPGVILNNSNQTLSQSQLGGLIQGNGNLKTSGPARVILNEVTGANRSVLEGATEVLGTAADVVVANPNGLTCNGCGFINAPRVTLSTGTPELGSDGSLANLKVSRGDVTIGANGANLSQSDIFDIVSRTISVNGPVQTNGALNLIAGHNSYAYASGLVTALGSDGNEPGIAIDSSALGGMYAGQIKLIATDKGAGVNMQGTLAANGGAANASAMTLSADGKLTLGKTYSKGKISARSTSQSVSVQSTLFSDDAVVLEGKSAIELGDNALVGATGDVSLKAQTVTLGSGAFAASGLNSDGTQSASGSLNIQADRLNAGNGQLSGGGLLSIAAGTIDLSRASDTGTNTFSSLGAITIDAQSINATNGRVSANGDLTLNSANALSVTGGQFLSGGTLLASAANLTSSASLAAVNTAKLVASSGDITQSGTVEGNGGAELTASGNITNSGNVLSPEHVALTAGGSLTNTSTGVVAANNGLTLASASLSNDGTIAAQGGDLTINSQGALSNAGTLTALASATVTANGAITNSGSMQIEDALVLSTVNALTNSGTINAGSATVNAASFASSGLVTSRSGAIAANVSGDLQNSGEMSSSANLTLSVNGDVSLTGKTIAANVLTLNGTNSGKAGQITIGSGALVNGAGGLALKGTSLTNAGSVGSGSGDISASLSGDVDNSGLIYAAGSSMVNAGGTLTNSATGEISARNQLALTITNDLTNSGKLLAVNALTATSGGALTNNTGAVMQGGTVKLGSASLANSGTLTAESGALDATIFGNTSNSGELSSAGDLTLATTGSLTNSGKLISLGSMTLEGVNGGSMGAVTNRVDGLINGQTGFTVNASSLTNEGAAGSSTGDLAAYLSGDLDNTGLLYSSGSSLYSLNGNFTNTNADVIAEQNLTIKGLSGTSAGNLTNTSGTIEAVSGDMALNATSITNKRTSNPVITSTSTTSQPVTDIIGDKGHSTGGQTKIYSTTTTTTTTTQSASGGTAPAQILSGRNMALTANVLTNAQSQIAAGGDLAITANSVTNEGIDLIKTEVVNTTNEMYVSHYAGGVFNCGCAVIDNEWTETEPPVTTTTTIGAVYGTIQAGGTLTANVSGYLDNNAVRGGVSQTGLSSGQAIASTNVAGSTSTTAIASTNPTSASDPRATVSLDTLNVAISGLTGRKATFETAASPDMPYVIETRSQFIDPSKFLGSDYFLKQIGGYNPEANLKRLGDAYFETRLVQEQIFEATGSRTLGTELTPYQMMQALYDNALVEQKALGLATGVALTPDQIAGLTQNIVWLEKQTVNGQDVLVPRLYLAKATIANVDVASAQIKGGSVSIQAGGFNNSGAIASDTDLALGTSGSFLNSGGSLFAKNDLTIDATGSFDNKSGTVSANNIAIKAASISNDTVVTRDLTANGFADRAQQQARIAASGNLLLNSAGSITSTGSQLSSGGDMVLKAGSSIDIAAVGLESSSADTFSSGAYSNAARTNTLASVSAGGNLTAVANDNIALTGVNATVGGNAALSAGKDVTIASVEDSKSRDVRASSSGFWSSSSVHEQSSSSTVQSSTLQTGGDLAINAGRDAIVSASQLTAGTNTDNGAIGIDAGRNIIIASGVSTEEKQTQQASSGFLNHASSSSQSYDETNVASQLKASGNVALKAGEAAAISGSSIEAGKALSITGSSVSVIGAEESHASNATKSESGLFVGSGGGFVSLYGSKENNNSQSSTSNIASTLKAGTDVSLSATGTDVTIIGSNVTAGQDLSLSAARDVNVTPGSERSASSDETKRSGIGISVSSTSGGVSIGIGYNKVNDTTQQAAKTNALSTLSAGRDLSISARQDINLQAAQVSAERDVSLDAVRDVNMLAAQDSSNYAQMHEQLFAGISLNVSSGLVAAGQNLASAASGLSGKNSQYALAPTALAADKAYNAGSAAYQAFNNPKASLTDKAASLASASLTIGFNSQKTSQTASSTSPAVTTIRSGGSTAIVAETGTITGNGVQIAAGYDANGNHVANTDGSAGNVLLSAGKDINLSSVQGSSSSNVSSKSVGASVGIDLASGLPVANGSFATDNGVNSSTSELNSHVSGTGTVVLNSGNDTNLKGAVVSGNTVIANVGHDLNIESTQDKATYNENSFNASAGFGPSGASGSLNKGTVKGDYANVTEQSGIVAGEGGYHVAVGNGVDLKGGVIASTATKDKNSLSADHLTFSDLNNSSNSSVSNIGVSVGSSMIPVPNVGQPAKETNSGKALATLTQGNLNLANQSQDLASLNTDLSKANTQATVYDIEELKAKQRSAAALSELLNEGVGTLSQNLHFEEGSPEKIALHAAVGALVSKLAGGDALTGALAGGASEIANGVLQDMLKANPNLSDAQKSAITQWVAAAVGAAAGGEAGAATALDNVNHNYLTHKQLDELALKLAACGAGKDAEACKAKVSQQYEQLDFDQQNAFEACRTTDCLDKYLADMQFDQKLLYSQILAIQELGADSALGQRLLSNQVDERPLTGDGSVLDQRIMDVIAGVSYCEDHGQASGCFETGQRLKYFSESVTTAAYTVLGVANLSSQGVASGATKGGTKVTADNFFEGTQYTSKVKTQAASGDYHGFPESVDAFSGKGTVTEIKGGDGITRWKLEIPGSYDGKTGTFEYIRNPDGTINHRLFVPE